MPNPLEWMFRMQDLMSGPAARMQRQVNSLNTALKALSITARQNQLGSITDPLKRQRAELTLQRDRLLLSKKATVDNVSAVHSLAEKIKENRAAMRDWLLILDPIARGLRWISSEAQAMGMKVAAAVSTRQDAMLGFRSAFGAGAGAVADRTQRMSLQTGRPFGELADQQTRFGALGMSPAMSAASTLAISDARVRKLDAERLEQTLTSMASRPMLDMREIKGGLTGVMDEKLFWSQLAKNLHVPVGDANQMVERNLVPREVGERSLLQAFQGTQGGRLGIPTLERANTTLQGGFDKLRETIDNLFAGVEKTRGFRTFDRFIRTLTSAVGGSRLQGTLNGLVNTLGKFLEPLTGPDGKKRMEDFFDSMADRAKHALGAVSGIVENMKWFTEHFGRSETLEKLGDQYQEKIAVGQQEERIRQRRESGDDPNARLSPYWLPNSGRGAPQIKVENHFHWKGVPYKDDNDMHQIARKFTDQVTVSLADALEQFANEQGAQ